MAIPIIFNSIMANNVTTNSMINTGQNQQSGWFSNQKRLKINGSNNGIVYSYVLSNGMLNSVLIDSPAYVPTYNISPQGQTL